MFVAIRDIRFAKGRFALMVTVVAMVTVLIVILTGLTAGLGADSTSAIVGLPADHIAFDTGGSEAGFADSRVSERQWQDWSATPGVSDAAPVGITQTRVGTSAGNTHATAVFGVDAASWIAPDAAQGNDLATAPGAALVSAGLATDLGVGVGDELALPDGSTAVVGGIGTDASYGHMPVLWLPLASWQRVAATQGAVAGTATAIALRTHDGVDLADADARIGTTTMATGAAAATIGGFAEENGSLTMIRMFLFAISALVVGAFFTVWTVQRRPEIAVLKALGASTRYLLRDALAQAAIVLVLAGAAGGLVGAAIGAAAASVVPFTLDLATVLVPVVVMVGVGIAGAALAVRRISSVDPLTALGATR